MYFVLSTYNKQQPQQIADTDKGREWNFVIYFHILHLE